MNYLLWALITITQFESKMDIGFHKPSRCENMRFTKNEIPKKDSCFTESVVKYKSEGNARKWIILNKSKAENCQSAESFDVLTEGGKNFIKYNGEKVYMQYDTMPGFLGDFSDVFFKNIVDSLSDFTSFNTSQVIFFIIDKKGKVLEAGNCTYRSEKYYSNYIKSMLGQIKAQHKFSPALINGKPVNSIIALQVSFRDNSYFNSKFFSNNIFNVKK
jgi:hypothetical protein